MKNSKLLAAILLLSAMLLPLTSRAQYEMTATNSGNWEDPTIWDSGIVPGVTNYADIPTGINVTVSSNAIVEYIQDLGTVTMAPNATLNVVGDPTGAFEDENLGALDATATGNTVIYSGNAHWGLNTTYYNLVFSGNGTFWNGGANPPYDNEGPTTILGNLTVSGSAGLQDDSLITVDGNATLGGIGSSNIVWDSSQGGLNVLGSTIIGSGAVLKTLDANGPDNLGSLTIAGGRVNLGDSTNWFLTGNFTNISGTLLGTAYSAINFFGSSGNITGTPFNIETFNVTGQYEISATINVLTNTPGLAGSTLVFDLANPGQIILSKNANQSTNDPAGIGTFFYPTNGTLDIINSGPAPASGATYTFFVATNYSGNFAATNLAALPSGLSWVSELGSSGSFSVTGTQITPKLSVALIGGKLTLSWDSPTFPGYEVQARSNLPGGIGSWSNIGSGTNSPYVFGSNPASPQYYRLANP